MKKVKNTNLEITGKTANPHDDGFSIVGIGASAGGLAAFEAFFSGMPADTDPGMAFVLVQHLAPDHKSILTDLIQRYTRMQVFEVEDGMKVQINCAYIIPPGFDMAFLNGCLQLLEPAAPRGRRLPIDFFFRSLAQDQRERSIAIILSGTGSDGSLGIRAIKAEAGMVMVQTPDSSEYDGMPCSAIDTGVVDFEMPPAEMAATLIAYTTHAFGKGPLASVTTTKSENALKKIFILLRALTDHDFSGYKLNTVMRRIERRMAVHQIDGIDTYVKFLQQQNNEVEALFRDLLIGVTNFFRDTEAFIALEETIIPKLFEGRSSDLAIRVWSPGCSSGEEPYSIAILLIECMERLKQSFNLQVFATDIDSKAITTARAGVYPASIASNISEERLSRFFSVVPNKEDGTPISYRINKNIRDVLIFSEQNVIKDPPFSKIDLISCRNLMIYLNGELQNKILPLFHYALNPGGLLFLGTSETVGKFTDLFAVLDRKSKLYQRKRTGHRAETIGFRNFPFSTTKSNTTHPHSTVHTDSKEKVSLREIAEQTLLKKLAPSSALVNSSGDILYLHGRTGMYLEPAAGLIGTSNILEMAREGLKYELTTALHKAVKTKETVLCPGLMVKTNSHFTPVDLNVCPAQNFPEESELENLFLVILQEGKPFKQESSPKADADQSVDIASLKQELKTKEEYLKNAIEDLGTTNEELKSSNEEMQSINEEMQSTNEELETSKEELQSVNEELATVNAELQTKVEALSMVNNDMNNLISGTGIATVFVDFQLCILRFTPTASSIINLIPGDVGRPINHFVNNLVDYETFSNDIQAVLDTLTPREIEVRTLRGQLFTMRILPYRTIENVIKGAVITFADITLRKQAEEKTRALIDEKELILKEVNHRIKNNMSTMKALLNLQAERMNNPDAAAAFVDAGNRMQSMELLYNKLYSSAGFSELSIKTYVFPLIDNVLANFTNSKDVKIEKHIDDFILDAKRLQPLGLIINELLTNIIKYAFTDQNHGTITVSATLASGLVRVIIQDDGKGIPESINFENSSGFGLILVHSLSEQIEGNIRLEREYGTKIILEFEL